MTRKLLVKLIASFYVVHGLWNIWDFFSPIFTSPNDTSLNLLAILTGAVWLWTGIYLFQLRDFGRKFAIVLLFLRTAYDVFLLVRVFFLSDSVYVFRVFGQQIFETQSVYPYIFAGLVSLLIPLGTIAFLMQEKTKAIFINQTARDENGVSPVKSVPNQ